MPFNYDYGTQQDDYWFTGGTGATLGLPQTFPTPQQGQGGNMPGMGGGGQDWWMQPQVSPEVIDMMALQMSDAQFYAQLQMTKEQWKAQRNLAAWELGGYMPGYGAGHKGQLYPGAGEGWMPTLQRQMGEGALGMNYLGLLGSLKGPQDWMNYANVMRNAQGGNLPAWAQSLTQGQAMPQWQAPGQGINPLAQQGPAGLLQQTGAQNMAPWSAPDPYQISQQQWGGLNPSERSMLQGSVEYGGGYWPDYMSQMQSAWPGQSAVGTSYWE